MKNKTAQHTKKSKPTIKVKDLKPRKNVKGGATDIFVKIIPVKGDGKKG